MTKKLISLLFVFALLLSLVACGDPVENSGLSGSDGLSVENENYDFVEPERVVLVPSLDSPVDCVLPKDTVGVGNSSVLYWRTETTELEDPSAEEMKTFTFGSKNYSLTLDRSYQYSVSSFGKMNRYRSVNADVECISGTNIVTFFMDLAMGNYNVDGSLTKAEAKAKAEEVVNALYGEDVMARYTFVDCQYRESQSTKEYYVRYTRYIGNYATGDEIIVYLNLQGAVTGVTATQFGLYESLAKNQGLSNAMIKAAEEDFQALVKGFNTLGDRYIEIGSDGKYYLTQQVQCMESYEEPGTMIYNHISMNIN